MVFRTSPVLGPAIEGEVKAPAFFDPQGMTEVSYQKGTKVQGSDGKVYVWTETGAGVFEHVEEAPPEP